MVHHKIHTYIDPFFVAGCRQILQIFHSSQLLLHLAEIRHRISAVGTPLYRIQKRHQMDIVDIAFLDIVKFRLHALHIAGKIVDIEHHTQHLIRFIPLRVFLPFQILGLQIPVPFLIKTMKIVTQFRKHRAVVIKLHIQPFQFIKMMAEPTAVAGLLFHGKLRFYCFPCFRRRL